VYENVNELADRFSADTFPSLKRRGGRDINKKFPFRSEAAGVVSSAKALKMHSETFRRTDHPGCGISVASRLLIKAAATPPFQGGEWARQSFIHGFCASRTAFRTF
jgi:hypothetical protein